MLAYTRDSASDDACSLRYINLFLRETVTASNSKSNKNFGNFTAFWKPADQIRSFIDIFTMDYAL